MRTFYFGCMLVFLIFSYICILYVYVLLLRLLSGSIFAYLKVFSVHQAERGRVLAQFNSKGMLHVISRTGLANTSQSRPWRSCSGPVLSRKQSLFVE